MLPTFLFHSELPDPSPQWMTLKLVSLTPQWPFSPGRDQRDPTVGSPATGSKCSTRTMPQDRTKGRSLSQGT